ncbi:hypothetical protein [Delftia acidovorans]|uniref:hypothetical protein n=1 Tax=Delftia acidovorans TaxID=80866 RepID=UPI00241F02E2|nr:hypothetical protein [Delftia acidovorans]
MLSAKSLKLLANQPKKEFAKQRPPKMAAFAFPPPPGAPGKACIAHGVQGLRGGNFHPLKEAHMPQTEEAEGLVYRHIEDDVERIIPTQAKAQAHDSAQKVEIHPRWRQTPDLREWPPIG